MNKLGNDEICVVLIYSIQSLLQSAQGLTNGKSFVVYPNSGEDWDRENG